jgi:hypothetical protein
MPLTISHPAASVLFARKGLALSALVIGSMTPDFPYFIPLFPFSGFSHSIIGLFVYCLPLGLISLVVFHFLIKYPALSLLPVSHQQRLYGVAGGFSFWPLRRFLLIILSTLLGAFTHILWDSFTHPGGWMVQQFIILKSPIFTFDSHPVRMYEFLQHSSTLLGGILLLYWYSEWYKRTKPLAAPENTVITAPIKLIILIVMSFMAVGIGVFTGLTSFPVLQTSLSQRLFVGHIFIIGVSTFIAELMLFSAYWHINLKKRTYG